MKRKTSEEVFHISAAQTEQIKVTQTPDRQPSTGGVNHKFVAIKWEKENLQLKRQYLQKKSLRIHF